MKSSEERPFSTMEALWEETENLGVAELRVLLFIARRLSALRRQYGPLDSATGRQFLRATGEEIADALIYLACRQELDNVPAVDEADSLIGCMKDA